MSKNQKTNAVRKLEKQNIAFELIEYELTGDQVDGVTVADKIGYPVFVVYKTLLVTAGTNKHFVCIIPVHKELNLKEVAKAVGEKSGAFTVEGITTDYWLYSRGVLPNWDEEIISNLDRCKCRESRLCPSKWWENWSSNKAKSA